MWRAYLSVHEHVSSPKSWGEELLGGRTVGGKNFTSTDPEVGIIKIVSNKIKDM
jgi:hypothetical protein